ncbi:MAG: AAA family ATPase [Desulfobacteraceae bacterium]|nr:AAA family ATPase [Desulfobacteraceae bacterium]
MKLTCIDIQNYRGIHALKIPLDKNLTVFSGSNGSGKTTILESVAILLSWVTARTRSLKSSGRSIPEKHIQNLMNATKISVIADTPESIHWQLVKTRPGRKVDMSTDMSELKTFILKLRDSITESDAQCSIPMFAYYPVNRAVLDIPLRIRTPHKFELLEAWDESLTSAANFRSFFEWFRQREDLENENRSYLESTNKPEGWEFPDRQLNAVRQALTEFLPEFADFRVRRKPLRMTVFKMGEELSVEQLSEGEKCMIALVGDLARRLAIANPSASAPLTGEGIVLIDEFDLHLHPMWQRRMVRLLPQVFKNCQFLVTTHSPQALGEINADQLWILYRDEEQRICARQPSQSYGLTSNEILNEIMVEGREEEQLARTPEVERALHSIFKLIDDENLEQAQREIDLLETSLRGEIPELLGAKVRMQMLGWDND